ncbi:MAG: hypothetical protein Q4G43_04905 [Mobilicoccus sp.]|nr:hypothetical protein [Mobilicoccus sp.]
MSADDQQHPAPTRPIAADWLTLRRPADEAAREGTQRLIARLWRHLQAAGHSQDTVHLLDLGAGTGANQAWLAPRLPFGVRWTLLDHDADLLHHPMSGRGDRVHGGLDEVPKLLDSPGPHVLTCSALLDLLTYAELDDLVDLLVRTSTPALFSLSVDGTVTLVPPHEDDDLVARAFDAHQRRDDIAGASGAPHLAQRAQEAGAEVVVAATPWRLTGAQTPLMVRYLTDRVDAAVEHDPAIAERAHAWLKQRVAQSEAGTLAVVVGHVDLLVLPQ